MNRYTAFYTGVLVAAVLLGAGAGVSHHPNIRMFAGLLALAAFALACRAHEVHISAKSRHINPEGHQK